MAILATRSTQCVSPLDGTLRVDLRSTKRAPARLSDISFVSAGKKRGFCQLRWLHAGEMRIVLKYSFTLARKPSLLVTVAPPANTRMKSPRKVRFTSFR